MSMTHIRPEIDPDAATRLASGALAHARANGWQVAVAVVDAAGILVAFCRTADVDRPSVGFAMDKAYTAASLRISTKDFFARTIDDPSLAVGLANRPRLIVWGGGVPVFHQGVCIGGIGVSGARDFEDIACAEAALAELGLTAG